MKQLTFENMEAQTQFETIVEDAILYCKTTATVGGCVLKEIKARGKSVMGAKAFVHMLLAAAAALDEYACKIGNEQGLNLLYLKAQKLNIDLENFNTEYRCSETDLNADGCAEAGFKANEYNPEDAA